MILNTKRLLKREERQSFPGPSWNSTIPQTLRYISICTWPLLTHSENHCSIHPVLLPGMHYLPKAMGGDGLWEKKKKTTVLIMWNLSLQDEKQKWFFFLPNCLLNFLHYALNIYFLPNLYLKVDILKYHIQLILYLGFVFSSIYSVSNCVPVSHCFKVCCAIFIAYNRIVFLKNYNVFTSCREF